MDSIISETGALIIEAGASGNIAKLWTIKKKVDDDKLFRKICDEYSDFSTGRNVLHHAAEVGHYDICRFLIKSVKVYIDAASYTRDTPLILAVKEERVEIVEYLIYQGANVHKSNLKGYTALHYAVIKDNGELMKLLLLRGAPVNRDSVEGTPLQCAASRGNVEAVKFLLSQGAQPNLCLLRLEGPLGCAIKSQSFVSMDALLKAQADPNIYSKWYNPLSYAAKEGDTRYLKSLLEAGADPNSTLTGLMKPIECAALAHNREGVEILFPRIEPLEDYPEWSVDGIMEFCHSETFKTMKEKIRSNRLVEVENIGKVAVKEENYDLALVSFQVASLLDPSNPKWPSMRSLCQAHLRRHSLAMFDVEKCFRLETRSPEQHHGGDADADAAAEILKKFLTAGLAFTLEPHNKENETVEAFRCTDN